MVTRGYLPLGDLFILSFLHLHLLQPLQHFVPYAKMKCAFRCGFSTQICVFHWYLQDFMALILPGSCSLKSTFLICSFGLSQLTWSSKTLWSSWHDCPNYFATRRAWRASQEIQEHVASEAWRASQKFQEHDVSTIYVQNLTNGIKRFYLHILTHGSETNLPVTQLAIPKLAPHTALAPEGPQARLGCSNDPQTIGTSIWDSRQLQETALEGFESWPGRPQIFSNVQNL